MKDWIWPVVQLVGYVLMFVAFWFVCQDLGTRGRAIIDDLHVVAEEIRNTE
jgi:hypothetical protein